MKTKFLLTLIIFLAGMQLRCHSQFNEGDSLSFWSPSYIDWPPLWGAPQREIQTVCKKAGNHCYVFTDITGPQISQADADNLVQTFDNQYYDALTSKYGPVPDVFDGDSNIFIVFLDENNWCGYFDPGQQMTDSMVLATWGKHSTEREIIFVASQCYQTAEEIVAHEFGHLLHWQQDHSPEPAINPTHYWEDAWVDEGFSTFAAIYLTENIFQHNIPDNYSFFTYDPDIPLIYFSDYNQVKLFMLFMFEHYGGWNYISTLISNQLNGIPGVQSTLGSLGYTQSFDDVFEQWVIANYIDDSLYDGGKYRYTHYDFYPCALSDIHSSFPLSTVQSTVNPYAADYIGFTSSTPKTITITFNGQPDSKFRVDMILKNSMNGSTDTVISMPLDSLNRGTYTTSGFGAAYDMAVMAVMNLDSTIHDTYKATYSYAAAETSGVTENNESNVDIFMNPATSVLLVNGTRGMAYYAELLSPCGSVCYSSTFCGSTAINTRDLAHGIYLFRITGSKQCAVKKIIIR